MQWEVFVSFRATEDDWKQIEKRAATEMAPEPAALWELRDRIQALEKHNHPIDYAPPKLPPLSEKAQPVEEQGTRECLCPMCNYHREVDMLKARQEAPPRPYTGT